MEAFLKIATLLLVFLTVSPINGVKNSTRICNKKLSGQDEVGEITCMEDEWCSEVAVMDEPFGRKIIDLNCDPYSYCESAGFHVTDVIGGSKCGIWSPNSGPSTSKLVCCCGTDKCNGGALLARHAA